MMVLVILFAIKHMLPKSTYIQLLIVGISRFAAPGSLAIKGNKKFNL